MGILRYGPNKFLDNERRDKMGKFWVKLKFKQKENAEQLIKAFFQEFNQKSSILVRGEEAEMEIIFQEPPMPIIEEISKCEIIEMICGKNFEHEVTENEAPEQSKQKIKEKENSEQLERPKRKRGRPATKNLEPKKEEKQESIVNIPELDDIAKKANSFEHFAKLVAEWMNMQQRKKYFTNLIIVSAEVKEIKWKELNIALDLRGIYYSREDKTWASLQVSEKLNKYSVTILTFLNIIKEYKKYPFKNDNEI